MTARRQESGFRSGNSISVAMASVIAGLGASALALGFAPLLMPDSYSWVSHTTSESAAQGVEGAWLARLGFVLFGLSVLLLATLATSIWGMIGTILHGCFGALMLATAAFSHRPWETGMPFDRTEDLLHSITATGMGFAFAFGVVAVMLGRAGRLNAGRALDILALVAAIVIPIAMSLLPEEAGLLQRGMFLIAYVWYAVEAVRLRGTAVPSSA